MKLRLTLTENRKDWPLSHVIVVGKRHCKEEPSDSFKCPALLNQDLIFAPVAESFPITFIRLEEQPQQGLGHTAPWQMVPTGIDIILIYELIIAWSCKQETLLPIVQAVSMNDGETLDDARWIIL